MSHGRARVSDLSDRLMAIVVGDARDQDNARSALAALADPGLKSNLSTPAIALASAMDQSIGMAMGLGKGLSEAGTDKIASMAGDMTSNLGLSAEVLSATADAVPAVAALVKVAIGFVNAGLASTKTSSEYCREWQIRFAPKPSGSMLTASGQPFVPADYFRRDIYAGTKRLGAESSKGDYPTWNGIITPSDRLYRSLLAMGLMTILEGTAIDPRDLSDADWRTGHRPAVNASDPPYAQSLLSMRRPKIDGDSIVSGDVPYSKHFFGLLYGREKQNWTLSMRKTYDLATNDQYNVFRALWHKGTHGNEAGSNYGIWHRALIDIQRQKRGVPEDWRRRFRRIRRGIEALWGRGDGGAALWVLYLDLLASAFRKGYLTRDFCAWQAYALSMGAMSTYAHIPCHEQLADQIAALVSNWQNTIDPKYDAGRQKIEQVTP